MAEAARDVPFSGLCKNSTQGLEHKFPSVRWLCRKANGHRSWAKWALARLRFQEAWISCVEPERTQSEMRARHRQAKAAGRVFATDEERATFSASLSMAVGSDIGADTPWPCKGSPTARGHVPWQR